jgi:hypothetical protein
MPLFRMPMVVVAAAATLTAAAITLSSTPAGAAGAPYLGDWTVADSCTTGESELLITGTTWSSVDFVCKIRSVSGGAGVWRFKLHKCEGDGVKKAFTVKVWVRGNTLTQQSVGETGRYSLKRC